MTSALVEAIHFVEGFVRGRLIADFIFDPHVNFDPSGLVCYFVSRTNPLSTEWFLCTEKSEWTKFGPKF